MTDFVPFSKVPRLSREMIITEKLDGTNASVWIEDIGTHGEHNPWSNSESVIRLVVHEERQYVLRAGSRKRFLMPEGSSVKGCDNHGFAAWVRDHAEELVNLGKGVHHGEWWGRSIQRGYGLKEKRFSLFNVSRWMSKHQTSFPLSPEEFEDRIYAPRCCHVVPVLYRGVFNTSIMKQYMMMLKNYGSKAAPQYMNPEGIVIYHVAARQLFKKTFEDDEGKG